ncbi:uncharacterized protein [Littorina saxatilis]|uniref:Uncharacterized protein n=1 Tax=Littorina saxatilis TaxID=31220 RepID=A0AAN9BJK0_9CAEN
MSCLYALVWSVLTLSSQVQAESFNLTECNEGRFDITQHKESSLTCIGLTAQHNIYWSITDPFDGEEIRIGECRSCSQPCPSCSVVVSGYNASRATFDTTVLQILDTSQIPDNSTIKCSSFNNATQTSCQAFVILAKRESGSRVAVVAGGTVGLVSLVVIALIVAVIIKRKRTPNNKSSGGDSNPGSSNNGLTIASRIGGEGSGHIQEGAADLMNDTFLSAEDVRALMAIRNLGHPISIEHLNLPHDHPPPLPKRNNETGNGPSKNAKPKTTANTVALTHHVEQAGQLNASGEREETFAEQTYARVKKKPKKKPKEKNELLVNRTQVDRKVEHTRTAGVEDSNNISQLEQDTTTSAVYRNIGEVSHIPRDKVKRGKQTPNMNGAQGDVELTELNTKTKIRTEAKHIGNHGDGNRTRKAAAETMTSEREVTKTADIDDDDDYHNLHHSRPVCDDTDPTYNHLTSV